MTEIIQGVIHGKTIVLAESPGLADGQPVEVVVRAKGGEIGVGPQLQSAAGLLADFPEMDAEIEEILRERKTESRREIEG
jgi:hypothetical protein